MDKLPREKRAKREGNGYRTCRESSTWSINRRSGGNFRWRIWWGMDAKWIISEGKKGAPTPGSQQSSSFILLWCASLWFFFFFPNLLGCLIVHGRKEREMEGRGGKRRSVLEKMGRVSVYREYFVWLCESFGERIWVCSIQVWPCLSWMLGSAILVND